MNIMKFKQFVLAVVLGVITLGHASLTFGIATDDDVRSPELPVGCEHLAVPEGHRVAFKTYAVGVQKYRWNGTSWSFIGPEANLFASPNYRGLVGSHYGGPTWESNSGSIVTSLGTLAIPCTPNVTAIPWLRLPAVTENGPGIFEGVTFIQRVNTVGGIKPSTAGSTIGETVGIPYATEYYFYKEQN